MPASPKEPPAKMQSGSVPNPKEAGVKRPLRTGWCARVVEELPEPTKRRYKVLQHPCQVLSEPNLHGKLLGVKKPGDLVDCCEVSMNSWVKLADEPGWMPTSFRCWTSTEAMPEGSSELLGLIPREGSAAEEHDELVVQEHQPQGICCFEVVFKSVLVRKLPNRQSLPLGVCKQGEYVFAYSQNFEGWVRLEGQEGWMLGRAAEHGELLRPRSAEAVLHVDLWALSEVWAAMRKAAFPIQPQMVAALKDMEERAATMASADPKLRERELQQLRLELRHRDECCREAARSEDDAESIDEDVCPAEGDAVQLDGEDGQMLHQLLQQRLFVRAAVRLLREEPFKDLAPDFALYMCLPPLEAPQEGDLPTTDSVVYDSVTGEAIGLWNEETQQVVAFGTKGNCIIQVGDRTCIVAKDQAVYDLTTKEMVGVYNADRNEVIAEVGCDTSSPLGEYEESATAEISTEGSGSKVRRNGERSVAAAAPVPIGVDGGTGGMPQTGGEEATSSSSVVRKSGSSEASSCAGAMQVSKVADALAPVASAPTGVRDAVGSQRARKLEEAMALGAQCAAAEREGPSHWLENVWEEVMQLQPVLFLAVQPEFELPPQFQQAMSTLVTCLLHAPEGQLQCAGRLVDLLEFQDLGSILRYFDWLEAAVRELSLMSRACYSTEPIPGRVQSALQSWSEECALFQQSAVALWEALLCHAPEYLSKVAEQRKHSEAQQDLQAAQVRVSMSIAQELKAATSGFAQQLRNEQGSEWPALAHMTEAALVNVQNLTSRLLACNESGWSGCVQDHEALSRRTSDCDAAMSNARRQVRRHMQGFRQSVDRFTEFGGQIVAWVRALVPNLQILGEHRGALRTAAELKNRLPRLESQKIEAEDQLDAVVMQLRRHRRHVRGSWKHQSEPTPSSIDDAVTERQLELQRVRLEEHVQHLAASLREAELSFAAASAILPLTIDSDSHDEGDEVQSDEGVEATSGM